MDKHTDFIASEIIIEMFFYVLKFARNTRHDIIVVGNLLFYNKNKRLKNKKRNKYNNKNVIYF